MCPLVLLALVPVSLAAPTGPASDPLEALVRDSPFLPAGGVAPAAAAAGGGPLEFRSVVFEHGQFAFSIHDQASRQSRWVRLGAGEAPFVARSYDREHDVLTVDYQGRTLALKLQPAHTAGPAPAGAVPPLPTAEEAARQNQPGNKPAAPAAGAAPPAPAQPGAPSPAEGQRQQDMADQIRRRRSLAPSLPRN